MFVRLKKFWRWLNGKGEYHLTSHESVVLTHVLRTLSNYMVGDDGRYHAEGRPYDKVNLELWNVIMSSKERPEDLKESNLDTVMRSLSQKLLKQQDYD